MELNEALRELLKKRDEKTLDFLFRELNPYLVRYLGSKGVYGERVDDLIAETWVTFLKKIDDFEGRSSVKTYLTGIIKLKAFEGFRADQRYINSEDDSVDYYSQSFTPDGWWKHEPEDPSNFMYRKEISQFLIECMQGLSESQQRAFFLKEVEGEETESICAELSLSVSNLGVLIFRAKDKLKKCLTGKLGEV